MADYTIISAYALGFFFVINSIYLLIKSNTHAREKNLTDKMDRICQLFTVTNSLEQALRKSLEELSPVNDYFKKITDKVDKGEKIEIAIFESAGEANDEFFRKLCMMMISANVSNGAGILYDSVKNVRDELNSKKDENSKIMLNGFLTSFVMAFIMPLICYIMLFAVQVQASVGIAYFLAYAAACSALVEGVVFKKWIDSAIKLPMAVSVFYIAFFYIGPKLMAGFGI